jgi:hypothetical protein
MRTTDPIYLTFLVPREGKSPSEFRRAVQANIRETVARSYFDGKLDAARADEIYRAVPVEDVHE